MLAVDCGPPIDLYNAAINVTGTFENQTAAYTCDEGFQLQMQNLTIDNSTIVSICEPNGFWSDLPTRCIGK